MSIAAAIFTSGKFTPSRESRSNALNLSSSFFRKKWDGAKSKKHHLDLACVNHLGQYNLFFIGTFLQYELETQKLAIPMTEQFLLLISAIPLINHLPRPFFIQINSFPGAILCFPALIIRHVATYHCSWLSIKINSEGDAVYRLVLGLIYDWCSPRSKTGHYFAASTLSIFCKSRRLRCYFTILFKFSTSPWDCRL